ncbi:hypothetical protein Mesci_6443 (plasmid) [Mesorhizobium ciceri biovar biserrulae WSM1271]|uniref:Uncharacterized protein n=1 Tax=Mesorhizobium ciceri biovar biserrulae (strain HAMBI 2942 / LMG 23838 / WSM1271) TaxID=765698 RepID=E8TNY4_MESCW|nr:hypothetical protein Mesci_6443 [Mesorhizobium ciceri biovar biserrulae WSM1271]
MDWVAAKNSAAVKNIEDCLVQIACRYAKAACGHACLNSGNGTVVDFILPRGPLSPTTTDLEKSQT